jgi:threonylcarbamoyladenosine tRNA methylthiotransferase MtaB
MSFSFGCRVNEAEKQQLDRQLLEAGFLWDEKNPQFYIINTCAVTGKAEREVRQHIYQIRKKYPRTKIVATGCSATLWMKNNTLLNEVDYWIDNIEKNTIVKLLTNNEVPDPPAGGRDDKGTPDKFLKSGRVMIKIQDGCDRFCSYCIVPYTRGRATSKSIDEILKEIQEMKIPIKEVILTAINTEYFGKDTGETLTGLVDSIFMHTKIERISFGSIHPWSITDEFLSWYKMNKNNPRFVHFFHVPIQSGSNTILKLMNRNYTREEILKKLRTLHAINPNALIATDVIVGFPGESDKEFEETYEFLKISPISKFHVFRYSPRPGTTATQLKNEPTFQKKRERSQKLRELGKQKLKLTT